MRDNPLTREVVLPRSVGAANPLALMSWQPKRADRVYNRAEWTVLCNHLHNGNAPTHFVMGFCDNHGMKQYKRSKRFKAECAISWAWSSILGISKSKIAFVPYSCNQLQRSRWGALDFDAHNGAAERARELAFAAFRCLLNTPDLSLVLETSGSGGWHVWAISSDFCDTRRWLRLLKWVASQIGVPIAAGICEIFPPDSLPSRFGKGMRAPGCWNPGTDTLSEIVWENCHPLLASLSGKSNGDLLNDSYLQNEFPDREKSISFSIPFLPPSPPLLYRELEWLSEFAINQPHSRNENLTALVGEMYHQVGREMAERIVRAQFVQKTVVTVASLQEHLECFGKLWDGLEHRWQASLSAAERNFLFRLDTENERDAFRIIRSYACKAQKDGLADFPVARDNLGQRLGITGPGAAGIRNKLARLGIIEKTASCKPNKAAMRFRWLPKLRDQTDCRVSERICGSLSRT